jgi:hypothetical protein
MWATDGHGWTQIKERLDYLWRRKLSCYTGLVLKSIKITVSEEVARWARRKATEQNTSVSKLVGAMLESQMRTGDEYWRAYDRWKKIGSIKRINAAGRLSREQAHERR